MSVEVRQEQSFDLRSHLRAVARLGLCVAVCSLLWRWASLDGSGYRARRPAANVARLVRAAYGLDVDADSVRFLTPLPASPAAVLRGTDVAFLARVGDKPRDAYLLHTTLAPSGIPVEDGTLVNLSRTADADEAYLSASYPWIAFAARSGGRCHGAQVVDLRGEDPALLAGWSRLERWMNGITNLQETHAWRGFDRRIVDLLDAPEDVALGWVQGRRLLIRAAGGRVVFDAGARRVVEGRGRAFAVEKGQSSLLGWSVDTIRALPFVGPQRIAWLEDKFYTLLDEIDRTRRTRLFTALRLAPHEPDVASDFSGDVVSTRELPVPGWPPKPFKPFDPHPMKGEGEWQAQSPEANPYFPRNPNAPTPIYESFVRPDPDDKPGAVVYAVAFDPRQITLDTIAGTKEPQSSTGAVGTGEIPRDDKTLLHIVAAFDGGWQTVHGDFGERTDGVDITAPQPYGATIARIDDETVGMGTWGAKGGVESVPPWMISYRQNLTPLTAGGKFNPYERERWGSAPNKTAPPGVAPTKYINRSAICLHQDGYLVYLWGRELNAPLLAKAVLRVGCAYTEMLDVNAGMAGFEFYRVHRRGDETAGAKAENDFSAIDKPVPGRADLLFDARELVHQMHWPRFPRYIGRDARDFIVLKLRDVLPGADLATPVTPPLVEPFPEGKWQVGGVYQGPDDQVFPPTVAWTYVRPLPARPAVRVDLVKLDPRKVDVALGLGVRESEAPAGLADPGAGATDVVLRLGLGLADPDDPGGLATEQHVHFSPQPGWPTLAIYRTGLYGREPRVAVGLWGSELPANEEGLVALVQGRPDGRRYQAPLVDVRVSGQRKRAAELAAPVSAARGREASGTAGGPVGEPPLAQSVAAALDASGFLVLAVAPGEEAAALAAALRLAGCGGTIVDLTAGRSSGAVSLTADGARPVELPDELALATSGESQLWFFSHPRPYATQIFTDTQVVKGAIVDRAQKFRHIAPPSASQPARGHHGAASSQELESPETAPQGEATPGAEVGIEAGAPLPPAVPPRRRHKRRRHAAAAPAPPAPP